MKLKLKQVVMVSAIAGMSSGAAQAVTGYSITDLGSGVVSASGWMGINNAGQVAGATNIDGVQYATIYTNGVIQILGTFGGNQTTATAISDNGKVTGFSQTTNGERAFLYENGTMQNLGTLGGHLSIGFGINNAGQVTGASYSNSEVPHAFFYSNGTMMDLGTLEGGSNSAGTAINNSGQVTGYSTTRTITGDQRESAFLYSNGTMLDIGTLGGSNANPLAINDNGAVTGSSLTAGNGANHAFLYSNGNMLDLGALSGGSSIGFDINMAGQVVGRADYVVNGKFASVGFLYSAETGIIDLNTLLPSSSGLMLTSAQGINDAGQILGTGIINGQMRDVILTPVPEPETYVMMLVGLGLLGTAVRRRKLAKA